MPIKRVVLTVIAVGFALVSCGSSGDTAVAPDTATAAATNAPPDVRVIANPEPDSGVMCDESCPSTVTIHDGSGAEVGRVDFDGFARVSPLVNFPQYPNRAFITEGLPTGLAAHVLDVDAGTSSKILDFASWETTTVGMRQKPGSPWVAISDVQGNVTTLFITDMRTANVQRFEATAEARLLTSPHFLPFSFSESEDQLAVAFADGRVQIVDTTTFDEIAQIAVPPGEELVGLSPGATKIATRPIAETATPTVRIFDLASQQSTMLETTGHAVGWYSEDRILTVDGSSAALITIPSGEISTPVPSLRSNHHFMPSTTRWHVSEMSDQVVLTDIESGEQRSASTESDDVAAEYQLRRAHSAQAWAFLGGAMGAETLGVLFLDLDTGDINVYRDRAYTGFVDSISVGISHDGRSAITRGSREPGRLLSDGNIVEIAQGEPSFCSDGSVAFAGRPPNTGFEARDAIVYPSLDAATRLEEGIVLGTQPHLICAS